MPFVSLPALTIIVISIRGRVPFMCTMRLDPSGTGREMLQPILDCLSSESSRRRIDDDDNKLQQRIDYTNNANGAGGGDGDIMSVPAGDQRYGVAHGELFVGGGSSECCAGISSCR